MKIPKRILPIIVISQFFCTSLWFAGNAVMNDLVADFNLSQNALGDLTSAVLFGFIIGTLFFALFTIGDRFSPSKVFFFSAIIGALFNLGVTLENNNYSSLVVLRFSTGFFLAGIYPIGMKIAADYYQKGLGRSLSFLVGALVLGTAFPHLLKSFTEFFLWKFVLIITSCLAVFGGTLILLLVPDGPYRKSSQKLDLTAIFKVFKNKKFKAAAFGYFGHMWELYSFWAFLPVILLTYMELHPNIELNIPLLSFIIIGIGGFSCFLGGYLSEHFGVKRVAAFALLLSGICCLLSPLLFLVNSAPIFIVFLILWSMAVITDSPLFSTLVATNASAETKGTALTIVNCIGFFITILSIQLLNLLKDIIDPQYIYMILTLGPILGLTALFRQKK